MKKKPITDPNLFMKLVLTGILSAEDPWISHSAPALLMDYKWEVYELEDSPHDYHIIGNHPVMKRLDFHLKKTVIH